jgi:hypothetical protein
MIDFVASERHFVDHLAPIWDELAVDGKRFHCPPLVADYARVVYGIRAESEPLPHGGACVVASSGDLERARAKRKRVVFVEHGVGFQFGDGHPSYSGGYRRGDVELYIAPNRYVERQNAATYPNIETAVVGCPKLDRHHARPVKPESGLVAVSWHWDCRVAPETRWAWPYYKAELAGLASRFRLLGHAHPRAQQAIFPVYQELGIEVAESFDEVLNRAELYVSDASSTIYEFASTGRPVVVLNAPWYRRDVRFGLRWWEHIPGPQVDVPEALGDAIAATLGTGPDPVAVDAAYTYRDGQAAQRAADAIEARLEDLSGPRPSKVTFRAPTAGYAVWVGHKSMRFDRNGLLTTSNLQIVDRLLAHHRITVEEVHE